YFRDIVFLAAQVGAPAKLALAPASASTQANAPVSYSATIQDANGNTVTNATNAVTFSASGVSGSFNPASPVAPTNGVATSNFTPTTTGTATITASAAGLTSASGTLTVSATGSGQSLFTTQTPANGDAADGVPYEIGMKFLVARAGQITAIRYWKAPSDAGTHVGHIWSATGSLLATVTFSGETASGWQQQALTAPLAVNANTTYTVSVNIITNYVSTVSGLTNSIVNGDISSVADGANGTYGSPNAFPTNSYQNSNYFRDIVFVAGQVGAPAKLALTPASASTQPNSAVTYSATIQDANGNTVTNATNAVTFSVSGVSGSFNPASPVSPVNGVATSNFTPTTTGTATITVSASGLTGATASLTVTSGVGPPAKLALTPANTSTQTGTAVTYTATVQDANGNTVTNATNPITFSVSAVSGSFNPAPPVAPVNGVATSTFTPTTTGTATITASATGLTSASATLTVSATGSGQSLFTTQTPANGDAADGVPYEVGMKFRVA